MVQRGVLCILSTAPLSGRRIVLLSGLLCINRAEFSNGGPLQRTLGPSGVHIVICLILLAFTIRLVQYGLRKFIMRQPSWAIQVADNTLT